MPLGLKVKTRLTRRRKGRRYLAPRVQASVKCGTCHKRMANPVTHVCTIKTDFTKRLAASKKPPARKAHPAPSACRDGDCLRQGCLGYRDGYSDGYAEGTAAAGGDR